MAAFIFVQVGGEGGKVSARIPTCCTWRAKCFFGFSPRVICGKGSLVTLLFSVGDL